jgi:hypothetical protein
MMRSAMVRELSFRSGGPRADELPLTLEPANARD